MKTHCKTLTSHSQNLRIDVIYVLNNDLLCKYIYSPLVCFTGQSSSSSTLVSCEMKKNLNITERRSIHYVNMYLHLINNTKNSLFHLLKYVFTLSLVHLQCSTRMQPTWNILSVSFQPKCNFHYIRTSWTKLSLDSQWQYFHIYIIMTQISRWRILVWKLARIRTLSLRAVKE